MRESALDHEFMKIIYNFYNNHSLENTINIVCAFEYDIRGMMSKRKSKWINKFLIGFHHAQLNSREWSSFIRISGCLCVIKSW